jgi:hypothetical protein
MPNWCDNHLTVRGTPEALEVFAARAAAGPRDKLGESEPLTLGAFVPFPQALAGTQDGLHQPNPAQIEAVQIAALSLDPLEAGERLSALLFGSGDDWFSWNLANWGTKWEIDDVQMVRLDDRLIYRFLSANSPPLAWLRRLALARPELEFELMYSEPSCAVFGLAAYRAGNLARYEDWDGDDPAVRFAQAGWPGAYIPDEEIED